MILVIDNYDSFTYNIVHLLLALEPEIAVRRNREITADAALKMTPEAIVLSPGPGRPADAGCLEELAIKAAGKVPLLGICLGHQAIAEAFGGRIVAAGRIMHGKLSVMSHDGRGIFSGLRDDFKAVRYHSLAVEESSLPDELEVSCRSEDGEIMGLRHRTFPVEAIQYHPESVMTPSGKQQIANFVRLAREFNSAKNGGTPC